LKPVYTGLVLYTVVAIQILDIQIPEPFDFQKKQHLLFEWCQNQMVGSKTFIVPFPVWYSNQTNRPFLAVILSSF
jgi:hypothetical protein